MALRLPLPLPPLLILLHSVFWAYSRCKALCARARSPLSIWATNLARSVAVGRSAAAGEMQSATVRVSFEVGLERRRHVKLSVIPQLDHEIVFFLPICSLHVQGTCWFGYALPCESCRVLTGRPCGWSSCKLPFWILCLCTLLLRLTGTYLTSYTVENLDWRYASLFLLAQDEVNRAISAFFG